MEEVSLFIAFGAGILSFFAPCILPLIPSYICFITGLSVSELRGIEGRNRPMENLRKILLQTILFIFGFSFIFVSLGATASFLGSIISTHEKIIRLVGGSVIIILGLHVAGVFNIKGLEYEKRFHLRSKPAGMLGSFLVGLVFAMGWTPCVGPVLAGILGLAGVEKTIVRGVALLTAYSLGLGIPFLLTAVAMNLFLNLFGRIKKYFKAISVVSGLLLITIGILIIAGWPNTI
ncbi:cytochrome c biogenesis protein CcdA [Candidatus Calescamantes bacterium]|nr:cytochrome c biogenesis protein CcdA [Candidatus Calescamantes bacterium]